MKTKRRRTIVLAFGTFDILHPGHLSYLNQCARFGDFLTVIVSLDEMIEKMKGSKPVFDEDSRRKIVASLAIVDRALLGDCWHHCLVIKRIQPDVICLGYDQTLTSNHLKDQLLKLGVNRPRIVRMKKWRNHIYKSSLIKKRLCLHSKQEGEKTG